MENTWQLLCFFFKMGLQNKLNNKLLNHYPHKDHVYHFHYHGLNSLNMSTSYVYNYPRLINFPNNQG
jgi:hypothetical protein